MCKYPVPGNGKTRLAKSIGMVQAASVSRALLLDLIANHRGQSYCLMIIASRQDARHRRDFQNLLPDIPVHIATGAGLRGSESVMWETFNTYLNHFRKVIAIYADTPLVGPSLVNEAFQKLDSFDVVIGPDMGDGYYLIGMKEAYDLFTTLSPDRVPYRAKTIELIGKLGLSYSILDCRADIDYAEDIAMIQWTDADCKWSRTMKVLVKLNLLPSSVFHTTLGKT
jgi:glycosyltransferase A (GT-A) superfamily protein (DUF2064 family)